MGIFERRKGVTLKMDHSTSWLSVITILITFITQAWANEPRVVCYYTNWSVYRPGTAKFNPQNINPYLCTHLIYAFGGFTKDNTLKPFDKYQDIEKGGYAKFTGLKTYNKNLKTMLAIGGWNEGSTRFSPMVASRERRKEFVRNAIKFLRQNHFDGLDLDWEYPAFRDGGKPKDRENYAKLVKELREEFEKESEKTGKPRLLLTMAVPAGIEYIQKGFDVKTLNRYLDWMNLLTYDYHSAFEPAVNHHAPLYPLEEPNEYSVDNELNIDYTIKFYIENGADRNKLVLGIPTYGRSYTLYNPDATEIGAPADGPGEQGDATREKGYLAYYEICESLKQKEKRVKREESDEEEEDEEEEVEELPWTIVHPNPNAMGPVAYKGNQWVGYDDVEIVQKKAEYVAENGLGGIMFWSIDNDDFRGKCHDKPYPLIEAAKEAYINRIGATDNVVVTEKIKTVTSSSSRRRNRPKSTPTSKPTTAARLTQSNKRKPSPISTTPSWSTPEPPTTPDPGSDFKCTDEGFFQHPRDCKKYFWCLDSGPSNLGIVAHQFTCPSGLFFNKAADSCDFARNVFCKKSTATTKAPATAKSPVTTKATTTTTESYTTRKSIKLSTRNSLLFRTTTSTAAPAEEEQDEEDEVVSEEVEVDAEDPRVIKELIDLIKKVGGVEQLEKHLHLAESSMSVDNAGTTTPASFNKKLYQKVLERTRKNKFNPSVRETNQNSRRGPQNAGLESIQETSSLRKERPQYTTINRGRQTVSTTEEPEEVDEDIEPSRPQFKARAEDNDVREVTTKPLQYVNIRRARPTSTSDTADDSASRNSLFERQSPIVSSESPSNTVNSKRESIPEYVTIRRQRPTTEEPTTLQYESAEQEEEPSESVETETSASPSTKSQPQYISLVRSRSTTQPTPPQEPLDTPEPTTVLAVQISSLLNSPLSTIADEVPTEVETIPSPTVTEATSTTTSSTVVPRLSVPPRRTVFKRRGSTTTAPSTSTTSTTQPPKRQRPNFLRRTKAPPIDATESSDNDLTTEFSTIVENATRKYTRRGLSKFKNGTRVEDRRRQQLTSQTEARRPTALVRRRIGGANASTTSSTTQSTPISSRRPFRVASRRRPIASTTTTSTTTTTTPTTLNEESLQDLEDSVEEPKPRRVPFKKTVKVQRRPLLLKDQDPSPSTDDNKRQSKKYSSSFKQNQLDEVLRQKSKSSEVLEASTESANSVPDLSGETAVAIAAHQLLAAPLPTVENFDEPKTTKKSKTQSDFTFAPEYTDAFFQNTATKLLFSSNFPSGYTTTPSYASTSRSPAPFTSGILTNSAGYSGVSQPQLHPSTARYLGTSEKYVSIPVEEFGYSTEGFTGGLGQEPVYFTREYLLESPVTKTYDDEYQYLSPITKPQTTTARSTPKSVNKKISTTQRPTIQPPISSTVKPRRVPQRKPFEKVPKNEPKKFYRPVENYDYYDDSDERFVDKYSEGTKVIVHGKGSIQCLDVGNFPHPTSCKKFISCAKMENGSIIGWEYICPKGLSFDPVGGICNWSAGLGCEES